jgi:hypothetical protein
MRTSLTYLLACFALGACATANHEPPEAISASASTLEYWIPQTSVKVAADVTVTGCSAPGAAQPYVSFKVDIQPTVTPEPSDINYRLDGGDLSGWWTSHDLALTLYDNKTLKSVNSTDSNRVLPVITNVIKTATSIFAAAAGSGNPNGLECTDQARKALQSLTMLKSAIASAQAEMPRANAKRAAELSAQIAAMSTEAGRLATSSPLNFTLPGSAVQLDRRGGYIDWDSVPKESVTDASMINNPHAFRLVYCLDPKPAGKSEIKCDKSTASPDKPALIPLQTAPTACGSDTSCTRTIVLREPKQGVLTIAAEGNAYAAQGKALKTVVLPIGQWGDFTLLSTSVGLAQTRTIAFDLDAYGAKTSLTWKSDARAESIAGGVASAADAASTLLGKVQGSDLAAQTIELNELQTQQKLNQLKRCKAILDAGGFVCPTS